MRNEITYAGRRFTDDSVESVSLHLASGLISAQLEADTMTAVVRSEDPSIRNFARNTPVRYFHRDVERFRGYLQSVERVGKKNYALTAISAVGLLTERFHAGGVYTGQTAGTVIRDICGDIPAVVKSNLEDVPLYGWLPYAKPPQRSARDNLGQVLFALGAAVRTDAAGALRFFQLWNGSSGAAPPERLYRGGGAEYDGGVSAVSVTEHQYAAGGEEATLFEGSAEEGSVIEFSEPMYGLTASGFSIRSSGANYAVLSAGEGVLKGRKYLHLTRQISRMVTPGAPESVKSISDATLVSLTNSSTVAERLAAYYRCRETLDCGVVLKRQSAGDVIRVYHPFDEITVSGCVESMEINASGILKADMRILTGYDPPQPPGAESIFRRIVVTNNTTVTIPEGVLSVRAVLIGGGRGGEGGTHGTAGTDGDRAEFYGNNGDDIGDTGEPGPGGPGGKGAGGGNILIVDIENPASLQIKIGAGAQGGPAHAPGEMVGVLTPPGTTDTTLSFTKNGSRVTYSSADGSASASGYADPITGEIYALPGEDGADGADGGSAGGINRAPSPIWPEEEIWEAVPGEAGGSAGIFPGGAGDTGFSVLYDEILSNAMDTASTRVRTGILSAGGGGAAYGAKGTDASGVAGGLSGTAGAGANALPPERNEGLGFGGNGGNGGGGGGAGGAGYVVMRQRSGGTYNVRKSQDGGAGGAAGNGSDGSDGSAGGVILYYFEPQTIPAGALMDKQKRFMLDRLGRLIVM